MYYTTTSNHQFQPHPKYYANNRLLYNGLVSFCHHWEISLTLSFEIVLRKLVNDDLESFLVFATSSTRVS